MRHDEKKLSGVAALVGGVFGCVCLFIYVNTSDIERMAAEAEHRDLWSLWDLPFALPWAFAGALLFWLPAKIIEKILAQRVD